MKEAGVLYIVATPIGNLEDMTLRALRVLKDVDLIACEDTRVTRKLLNHYNIDKPTISYHQHSKLQKEDVIIANLQSGKNVALVTDAGTPGISDPGMKLVAAAVAENIKIEPIPGTSALGAMISVAGIDLQKFTFLAFPPHKKGRETFFKEVLVAEYPVIYFESPHRVIKNLELMQKLGGQKNIIIGRELTKMFEEVVRGTIAEVLDYFAQHEDKVRGEFVVIAY